MSGDREKHRERNRKLVSEELAQAIVGKDYPEAPMLLSDPQTQTENSGAALDGNMYKGYFFI